MHQAPAYPGISFLSSTHLSQKLKFVLVWIAIGLFLSGCTIAPTHQEITQLSSNQGKAKVLMMPLDVELSLLTTGGLHEPRADWTEAATGFLEQALLRQSNMLNFDLTRYELPPEFESTSLQQLQKLHEVVGITMMLQKMAPLPTKRNNFRWSLGTEAGALAQAYDADYALFLFMRDSYATAGRQALVAASIIASAFIGTPVASAGIQVGYASLVDLKTGDIVWFNNLTRSEGDLREQTKADASIRVLLNGFPSGS